MPGKISTLTCSGYTAIAVLIVYKFETLVNGRQPCTVAFSRTIFVVTHTHIHTLRDSYWLVNGVLFFLSSIVKSFYVAAFDFHCH